MVELWYTHSSKDHIVQRRSPSNSWYQVQNVVKRQTPIYLNIATYASNGALIDSVECPGTSAAKNHKPLWGRVWGRVETVSTDHKMYYLRFLVR